MGTTKLNVNLDSPTQLNLEMRSNTSLNVGLQTPVGGVGSTDYNRLKNKPSINGVTLSGDKNLSDLHIVSENTTEGWAEMALYVPKAGEVCYYTDTGQIKIGDGAVPIVDLPYVNQQDLEHLTSLLQEHVTNTVIHVTADDKQRWNNPAEYDEHDENLIIAPY